MTAEPSTTSASGILFCLTNRRSGEFHLDASDLPWESRYSVILLATRVGGVGTEVLKAPLLVDDPLPTTVTLKAGERRCDEVDVAKRLPGFAQLQAADDVFVFWAYSLMMGQPSDPPVAFGGMVRLNRRRPAK